MDRDLVLLHQVRDALIKLLRYPAAALDDGFKISLDFARNLQSIRGGVLHVVLYLSRPEQCFGRDAAPIEADTTKVFTLDNGRLETELRAADRSDITTRTRTKNDDVVTY